MIKSRSSEHMDLLECPICYEQTDLYVKTPCSHNFCAHCLSKHVLMSENAEKCMCPLCRQNFGGLTQVLLKDWAWENGYCNKYHHYTISYNACLTMFYDVLQKYNSINLYPEMRPKISAVFDEFFTADCLRFSGNINNLYIIKGLSGLMKEYVPRKHKKIVDFGNYMWEKGGIRYFMELKPVQKKVREKRTLYLVQYCD